MRLKRISLFLLLLTGTACDYAPNDIYFKNVDPTPTAAVSMNFMNAPDTVIMVNGFSMNYSITGVDVSKMYAITVSTTPTANQDMLLSQLQGSFNVQPFEMEGYYTLTMTVKTSSGTGSLADLANEEQVVFKKSVVLHYLTKWPIEAHLEDGRLHVSWLKYPGADFVSYNLYITYPDSTGYIYNSKTKHYPNATATTFIDSAYVGNAASYVISVNTNGWLQISGTLPYNDPLSLHIHPLGNGQIEASWNKTKFYNNFSGYKITVGNTSPWVVGHQNINDTTATLSVDFGAAIPINVTAKSATGSGTTTQSYLWSDPHPSRFEAFTPNRSHNRYYSWYYNLDVYNMTNGALLDSIETGYAQNGYPKFGSSPSGDNVWVYKDMQFFKINPDDAAITRTLDASTIVGPSYVYVNGIGISDQGTLIFMNNNQLFTYDINTNTQVATPYAYPNYSYGNDYKITCSADGQYFILPGSFFQISGNTINMIGTYYDAIAFDEMNPSQYLVFDYKKNSLFVNDLVTNGVVQQFQASTTLPSYSSAQIDPVTKCVMMTTNTGSRIIVYDFVADKEIFNATRNGNRFELYNGTLYSGNGAKLKLN